jgi:hypothetical protein
MFNQADTASMARSMRAVAIVAALVVFGAGVAVGVIACWVLAALNGGG